MTALSLPPSPRFFPPRRLSSRRSPFSVSCKAQKKERSFTDQILDYIEGGPKLRKWYGASDGPIQGRKPEEEEDGDLEEDGPRDAVLVTNGDSEIGQMVILALIVKRARIKALVKDKQATVEAFGTYVEPVTGDLRNKSILKRASRGVRAVICPTSDGSLSEIGQMTGIEHIVLLSQLAAYEGVSGLQALLNSDAKKSAARDEQSLISSGIPYTIIQAASLQNTPGGNQGFCLKKGVASSGKLSKEDAAYICAEALEVVPTKGLVFEVGNGDEKVSDWKEWLGSRASE